MDSIRAPVWLEPRLVLEMTPSRPPAPHRSMPAEALKPPISPAFFVLGGAHASCACISFAHIRALFCISIRARTGKMIHLRSRIGPNNALPWTMRSCFGFRSKLSRSSRYGGPAASPDALTRRWGRWLRRGIAWRRPICRRTIGHRLRLAGSGRLPSASAALDHKGLLRLAAALNGGFVRPPFGLASFCRFLLSLTCGREDGNRRRSGDAPE